MPAETPRTLPHGYQEQRRVVIQLLKDWKLPYSTSRGSAPDADTVCSVRTTGHSSGHWNLNAQVLRRMQNTPQAHSHNLLEDELERMRLFNPLYYSLARVFLHDSAGDSDYERLCETAHAHRIPIDKGIRQLKHTSASVRRLVEHFEEHQTGAMKLQRDLEIAIHDLTMLLIDKELYAIFPEKALKTTRRQTMEESYAEIHRVFETWCIELSQAPPKRYRNRAYDNTALQMNVSRATVERAVNFITRPEAERSVAWRQQCLPRAVPGAASKSQPTSPRTAA